MDKDEPIRDLRSSPLQRTAEPEVVELLHEQEEESYLDRYPLGYRIDEHTQIVHTRGPASDIRSEYIYMRGSHRNSGPDGLESLLWRLRRESEKVIADFRRYLLASNLSGQDLAPLQRNVRAFGGLRVLCEQFSKNATR
jgi:hypothetical protein